MAAKSFLSNLTCKSYIIDTLFTVVEVNSGGIYRAEVAEAKQEAIPFFSPCSEVNSTCYSSPSYGSYGRRSGLMVSAFVPGASGPVPSPGRGHCVVFLGKTLDSHSASLPPGV